jgi:RNA polymerase sigma factor (sigma-70 family)
VISQTTTHLTLLQKLAADQSEGSGFSSRSRAWGEFVDRYGDLIRGFCRHHGVKPHEVDDVMQDVLLSLTKAMPNFRYDPSKGKFRSYLKTVTLHAIFARSRQNQKAGALQPSLDDLVATISGDPGADAQWEQEWRQYHIRLAMRVVQGEFSPRDMEAFERYAVAGEEGAHVAKDIGLSVDALYQIKSRVTRRLSVLIAQQVQEEG